MISTKNIKVFIFLFAYIFNLFLPILNVSVMASSDTKHKKYVQNNLTKIDISTFDEFKEAVKNGNVEISLTNDIVFNSDIEIQKNNIVISGNQHNIISSGYKFVIKNNYDIELRDIVIKTYEKNGLNIYKSSNVELSNISLEGYSSSDARKSNVGVDIFNSNVSIRNSTFSNNTYKAVQIRGESVVNLLEGNIYNNNKLDLQVIVEENEEASTVNDINDEYIFKDPVYNPQNKKYSIDIIHKRVFSVYTFEQLKKALEFDYTKINIKNDINFSEDIQITKKEISINGENNNFDLNNYKLTVKGKSINISNLTIKNYTGNGITFYNSEKSMVNSLKLEGNIGANIDPSNVGIDIFNSKVTIKNTETSNHRYKGIQIRGASKVDINDGMSFVSEGIDIQVIDKFGETPCIINLNTDAYVEVEGRPSYEGDDRTVKNIYKKKNIDIDNFDALIQGVKIPGAVLNLTSSIKLNKDIDEILFNSNSVCLNGNNYIIDLNNKSKITIKADGVSINNVSIKNSNSDAIHIYNSKDILLDNVNIYESVAFGVLVNGSKVIFKNIGTYNNGTGGVKITRSRTLRNFNNFDSEVQVIDNIRHDEKYTNVKIVNLEMLDGYVQDHKFTYPDHLNIYNKKMSVKDKNKLSDYYLDIFGIVGEDRNKEYQEITINYRNIFDIINVKETTEVKDNSGNVIQLKGDGQLDETDNIIKFLEYAHLNFKSLYFPQGIYKITRDIKLENSKGDFLNVSILGDPNGYSIIDGSSIKEKMLLISNTTYSAIVENISIDNMFFNNVGISFTGNYKDDIEITNNVFMNGTYSREYKDGQLYKAKMEPYITANHRPFYIDGNIFLRNKDNPGRGIATYRGVSTQIKNNFFGNLEDIDDAKKMLPEYVNKKLDLTKKLASDNVPENLSLKGSQGNFFTAINNERYDKNILISNNYFSIDKTRNITSDFPETTLISGINVASEGQRRDHIIYSKGYNNLFIVGNYFKGMENSAAGGIKLRNGQNVFVGSNHFDNVPLLTYIYPDLTLEETLLRNTYIYNNLFHQKDKFGEQGTGILYYQSFRDGDDLVFKEKQSDNSVIIKEWKNAYGKVENFLIYNNRFLSDERDTITISSRAKTALSDNQFVAHNNKYAEFDKLVNYNAGNASLPESDISKVNGMLPNNFDDFKDIPIPLTPYSLDVTYLSQVTKKLANQLKIMELDYNTYIDPNNIILVAKEIFKYARDIVINRNSTQREINVLVTLIQDITNKLKDLEVVSKNSDEDIPDNNIGGDKPGTTPNDINNNISDNSNNSNNSNIVQSLINKSNTNTIDDNKSNITINEFDNILTEKFNKLENDNVLYNSNNIKIYFNIIICFLLLLIILLIIYLRKRYNRFKERRKYTSKMCK